MVKSVEEQLKGGVLATAGRALNVMDSYLDGKEDDTTKIFISQKLLTHGIKILHMNQVKVLTNRSQALRLIKYLPDDETRQKYISITNPQAAPLLLQRPK